MPTVCVTHNGRIACHLGPDPAPRPRAFALRSVPWTHCVACVVAGVIPSADRGRSFSPLPCSTPSRHLASSSRTPRRGLGLNRRRLRRRALLRRVAPAAGLPVARARCPRARPRVVLIISASLGLLRAPTPGRRTSAPPLASSLPSPSPSRLSRSISSSPLPRSSVLPDQHTSLPSPRSAHAPLTIPHDPRGRTRRVALSCCVVSCSGALAAA